jgi:hypothetical protein
MHNSRLVKQSQVDFDIVWWWCCCDYVAYAELCYRALALQRSARADQCDVLVAPYMLRKTS